MCTFLFDIFTGLPEPERVVATGNSKGAAFHAVLLWWNVNRGTEITGVHLAGVS